MTTVRSPWHRAWTTPTSTPSPSSSPLSTLTSSRALSPPRARPLQPWQVWLLGTSVLLCCLLLAASQGAYAIAWTQWLEMLSSAGQSQDAAASQLVFLNIRLPRLLLGVAAGAGLGLAGALMQGLFRNPLADPGLIGVSSGAALAAGLTIVLGATLFPELPRKLGSWTLVLMAFAGGLGITSLIYVMAQNASSAQGTSMAMMLLAGVAVNALAGAGLGFLSFLATDEQLRSLQFWLLGSLGNARWSAVILVTAIVALACSAAFTLAKPLNALALGEAQASMLGVEVERLKRICIVITALAVGCVTASTGIIGFVGLIAPHALRLLVGSDHRLVLPGSALLGASLVLLADAMARTIAQPAELPLGVLTAFIGVPFFLLLLRAQRSRIGL